MKKKLTTLLTLALVAVFALALVACDDNSGSAIPTPPTHPKKAIRTSKVSLSSNGKAKRPKTTC